MWARAERHPYLILVALALMLFLPGIVQVPAIDRDEARFAQASKQMIETGELVDVRFQNDPRHKKPVGIYWLQALSAAALSDPPHSEIWPYRLPSLIGALGAVLLTFWAGTPLVGRRAALIGGALLGASLLLGVEARLAKTDAVLLATIVAAQGALARAYLGQGAKALSPAVGVVFWIALGVGILVKGPIAPLVVGLTAFSLALWDRRLAFFKALHLGWGPLISAAIVLPWSVLAWLATDGGFFTDALSGDLLPKLAGGHESHGAPPGYYVVLAFVTFWPGTLALGPALAQGLRARAAPAMRFLLAWAGPIWLVFELVPTKLPHYVLPAYPALALLCGVMLAGGQAPLTGKAIRILWWLAALAFGLVSFALAFALTALRPFTQGVQSPIDLALGLVLLAAAAPTVLLLLRERRTEAALGVLAASLVLQASAFGFIAPRLQSLWISTRVVAALPRDENGHLPLLVASGFSEPSLVFLAGTKTVLGPPRLAAQTLASQPDAVAAIAAAADAEFRAAIAEQGLGVVEIGSVSGLNYSVGRPVKLVLYGRTAKEDESSP